MDPDAVAKLEAAVGYHFTDGALLAAALTHRSVSGRNNERLEFLGDGILNFVIADELFHRRPDHQEGELSRLRASLVNRASLARIGRELALGDYLRLGSGELKSGGHRRESILADAVEAIFGAIYLDADFATCRRCIVRLYQARLEDLPDVDQLKDPKTRLQEYLQGARLPLPSYELLQVSGQAHAQTFRVACRVEGLEAHSTGSASSRRKAEQAAAQALLRQLTEKD